MADMTDARLRELLRSVYTQGYGDAKADGRIAVRSVSPDEYEVNAYLDAVMRGVNRESTDQS